MHMRAQYHSFITSVCFCSPWSLEPSTSNRKSWLFSEANLFLFVVFVKNIPCLLTMCFATRFPQCSQPSAVNFGKATLLKMLAKSKKYCNKQRLSLNTFPEELQTHRRTGCFRAGCPPQQPVCSLCPANRFFHFCFLCWKTKPAANCLAHSTPPQTSQHHMTFKQDLWSPPPLQSSTNHHPSSLHKEHISLPPFHSYSDPVRPKKAPSSSSSPSFLITPSFSSSFSAMCSETP